jgi:uroporphyrinogen-III decarboxylase
MSKDTYEARVKRVETAIALGTPDRVPCLPMAQTYPMIHAGYTVAECIYDVDKGIDAYLRYMREYEPDQAPGMQFNNLGMGKILELQASKTTTWAGAPDGKLDKNSIHQFIEFPILLEEEMEDFERDYTGWLMQKAYPRLSSLLEPFATLPVAAAGFQGEMIWGPFFARPDVQKMIATFAKIAEMSAPINAKLAAAAKIMADEGYPSFMGGMAGVPFDGYSDFYRGTIDSMMDLFEHRGLIERFCKWTLQNTLRMVEMQAQNPANKGKWIFMPLHKGMDTFLSDDDYRDLYWHDLQIIINKIIDVGMVPYIYTEGPYDTRIKHLKDVPKGKVLYHFEKVNMKQAKKELGGIACISGGFPLDVLHFGTKQKVIDKVKELIDDCAPGGGFIFETAAGFDDAPPENVEAMFDTVKTYGVYK